MSKSGDLPYFCGSLPLHSDSTENGAVWILWVCMADFRTISNDDLFLQYTISIHCDVVRVELGFLFLAARGDILDEE